MSAPDAVKWAYQLNRLYVFEDLAANLDKKEGTPIVDPQWNLIVLDHSLAFTNTLALPYAIGKELKQIDRPFFDRIKTLDKATVQRAIGDLVNADALEALFVRRDIIVKAFEKLAEQEGENKVFTRLITGDNRRLHVLTPGRRVLSAIGDLTLIILSTPNHSCVRLTCRFHCRSLLRNLWQILWFNPQASRNWNGSRHDLHDVGGN